MNTQETTTSDVDFWLQWIALQAEHNMEKLLECSIKDFHFKGLNYICFQFNPQLTIRLYVVHPTEKVETENVSIHNHLYDSQLLVLRGWLKNRVYQQVEGTEYNHYHLTSALHPENKERTIKLSHLGKVGLLVQSTKVLFPGMSHLQRHNEIHNVTNDPSKLAAWMVFEFPTVKEHSTLFSKKDLGDTIPTPKCYNRFTETELRWLIDEVLNPTIS